MRIHQTADVQTKMIGADTQVWQYSIILPRARIGNNCNINAFCFIENDVVIGDNVTVKCGVSIWDGIIIEDNVHIGPSVAFTNDLYPRSKHNFNLERTVIKKGSSIGANSTLVPGITIGEYAMIGAGSVVTKSVPNNNLWFGNPARPAGYVCNCGQRLDDSMHCQHCGSDYLLGDKGTVQKKQV